MFYDPPYIEKGKDLYRNYHSVKDHQKLANHIRQLNQPWIVTYDYDAAVRYRLFPDHRCLSFELSYSPQHRYHGREAVFFADRLRLPDGWEKEEKIVSMSSADSE